MNTSGWLGLGLGVANLAGNVWSNNQNKKEAEKARKEQVKNQLELNKGQKEDQLDIWNKTNFPEQVKKMKEAGLNPALMYGGAGGGGSLGSVGAGSASAVTPNIESPTKGMNIDPLTFAQVENIKASTEKTKAETENISGEVKTGLTLDNIRKAFENNINKESEHDQLAVIKETARKLTGEANSAGVKGAIDTDTQHAQQVNILAGAVNSVLQLEATKAGTAKTEAETQAIAESIAQKWQELKLKGEQINIERFKAEVMANTPSVDQVVGGKIDNLFNAISEVSNVVNTNQYRRKVK